MRTKILEVEVKVKLEILNEENFEDFTDPTQASFLFQEALDQSPWGMEGIGADVSTVTILSSEIKESV